ncbi:MAG: hypothetical protein LRY61_05385 [Burkholderiaceae bacterium]|nr:hypothetical protein [Burkholderiaceae bacterium]
MPQYTGDDYPEVGDIKQGYVLVYHGDDRPTDWIDWLRPLVDKASDLLCQAEENGINIIVRKTPRSKPYTISFIDELLDFIGIRRESYDWTGSLISGSYQLGWLSVNKVEATKALTQKLVTDMERQVTAGCR